jgi:hypothetical protein
MASVVKSALATGNTSAFRSVSGGSYRRHQGLALFDDRAEGFPEHAL